MQSHLHIHGTRHAAKTHIRLSSAIPLTTITYTVKNVRQKINMRSEITTAIFPLPVYGLSNGQIFLRLLFGYTHNGVQLAQTNLSCFVCFTSDDVPTKPPHVLTFEGTTLEVISQTGAVSDHHAFLPGFAVPLGLSTGSAAFCPDVTKHIHNDELVVRGTIRTRLVNPPISSYNVGCS